MEEAPENGKELSHSARGNGLIERISLNQHTKHCGGVVRILLQIMDTLRSNLNQETNFYQCVGKLPRRDFLYVLLTIHLSITLANVQLDTQFFYFMICLLQSSTCFEQHRAHHQEVKLY